MIDSSKKNVLQTKKISLENVKREKITLNSTKKTYESNMNTNSDNYEWIFDIYIPNLIDLVEEHKEQVKGKLITDSKLDKYIQDYIKIENYIMEGIRFSDTKQIKSEQTKNYLSKFRQIWNEHKAKWSYEYKIKYNKYIEGFPFLSQIFINDVNKSITNDSMNISNDKESKIEGQTSRISLFNKDDSRLYTERSFHDKSDGNHLEIKRNYNKKSPNANLVSNGNDRVDIYGEKCFYKVPVPQEASSLQHKSCCQCLIF